MGYEPKTILRKAERVLVLVPLRVTAFASLDMPLFSTQPESLFLYHIRNSQFNFSHEFCKYLERSLI